jgi:serine phosphatase RsbU (regulator of sigma subunit)
VLAVGLAVHAAAAGVAQSVERLLLRRDLELGRGVQRQLLPQEAQGRCGDWEFRIDFVPYGYMSGDWYQTWLGRDAAGAPLAVIAIGDGVGKGASAALCTVVVANAWRRLSKRWDAGELPEVSVILAELHEAMIATFSGKQNSTLSAVVLHGNEVEALGVGAPSFFVLPQAGGRASRLKRTRANPVGMPGDASPAPRGVRFVAQPGDLLITCTDGVVDGFASERLLEEALSTLPRPVDTAAAFAAAQAAALATGARNALPDDRTTLLLRYALSSAPTGTRQAS